ncbi:poly [ADP-ribose] polymerase 12-like [Paramuricea clavata]|uniref:Poly [ADP-ribose] polymerase 12-like n=1 Tax=Paramuricea clavata TaxID=317549 RepID=A0A7D9IUT1_PARCT|nr:poly [ADP-ribose] polymerase 12-like [Paramuricea clavata]
MDYSSLKATMKSAQRKPRRTSGSGIYKTTETHDSKLLASKLFSYLICHGEDCRLSIGSVAKRLQNFSGDKSYDSKKALEFVNSSREKFVVKNVEGKNFVEAKTSVKICDAFQEGKCKSGGCKGLHICRFFLEDNCKFGAKCNKPHGFDMPQTRELLAHQKLENLSTDALTTLFRKVLNEKKIKHASSSSGPSACKFYNKGDCKNGDQCEFLHVCEHYIDGDCKFGDRCKRSHNFDSTHARKVLAAHRLGGLRNERQILSVLQSNRAASLDSDSSDDDDLFSFLNLPHVPRARGTGGTEKAKPTSPTQLMFHSTDSDDSANEKTEICGFNLRGKCSYGNKCKSLHTGLPYQWQYCHRSQWKNFPVDDNREVEMEFCDHEVDDVKIKVFGLGHLKINFQRMTGETANGLDVRILKVRRLSTVSSVLAASGHVFRTTWKWYWQDEDDQWHCYDNGNADVTSEEIEQQFQSVSGERKQTFSAGPNIYTLYFDDEHRLYQQNDKFRTKRDVRRRPAKYLDEKTMKQVLEDFKRNRQRASSSSDTPSYSVPSTWNPIDPSEEFKVVELSKILHHDEYSKAKEQFLTTMKGFTVKSVKRVQNPGLWEDYERYVLHVIGFRCHFLLKL